MSSSVRVYNQTLCPGLWDTAMHLDPRIRISLLKIAYDFYKKTKFVAPIQDIYLMGSAANFNWTEESDVDVHLLIDFNTLKMPGETAVKITRTASSLWNSEHNVRIKGHKVEINIQKAGEAKPHVTGIYSLLFDQWVRKPQYQPVSIDRNLIQQKYTEIKTHVEKALGSGDREYMKSMKDFLDEYRQYGLDSQGELSSENIVYKILRSKGIIKKLKDAIVQVYDTQMTVPEATEKDVKSRHPHPAMPMTDVGSPDMKMMNMDNLKALRDKATREWKYFIQLGDREGIKHALEQVNLFHTELRKRLSVINAPVAESKDEQVKAIQDLWEKGHGKVIGACGHVIRQCRCNHSQDLTRTVLASCNNCKKKANEGVGMGKPENDPKAKGRWTVDYESSSKFQS